MGFRSAVLLALTLGMSTPALAQAPQNVPESAQTAAPEPPPPPPPPPPPTREQLRAARMYPGRERLPQSFIDQDWQAPEKQDSTISACFAAPGGMCDIIHAELDGAGPEELLVSMNSYSTNAIITLYAHRPNGWIAVGEYEARCAAPRWSATLFYFIPAPARPSWVEAMRGGDLRVAPQPYKDVLAGGYRLTYKPLRLGCGPPAQ
ncbi:MAG: hypothetical protein JNJ73_06880 [Hyphomonadaceae bacterium]|nr:hypothetical protein [Hyphomonadaceae bacterium]